uniref:Uncharacterized protein n=1 Tax=Rhabditophanes sp. KR3021 TaxID=114890 RepID=A0AC35TVR3_9BILA
MSLLNTSTPTSEKAKTRINPRILFSNDTPKIASKSMQSPSALTTTMDCHSSPPRQLFNQTNLQNCFTPKALFGQNECPDAPVRNNNHQSRLATRKSMGG